MNFSVWKVFGIFSTILILGLFFGGTVINIIKAAQTGDVTAVLKESGGKFFMLDNALLDETDYLLAQNGDTTVNKSFHFIYAVSILFMFFTIGMFLFKFGNWLSGKAQLSPFTDILIIALIIGFFFTLQFLYGIIVLDKVIWPLKGVYTFVVNLPEIFKNLVA